MDQHVKDADGGELTGEEWLALNNHSRAIAVEYPLKPVTRDLASCAAGKIIASRFDLGRPYFASLASSLPALRDFFGGIPSRGDDAGLTLFWGNGWFPPLDAITLCVFLYQTRLRRYVEAGSGNSTKFARALVEAMHLETQIVSIDPHPRAEIDQLCDHVIRLPLEEVDPALFATLERHDVLFLDSSHRAFQNSDVMVFFMEVLPALAIGTVYGVHDIFLPYDYPDAFVNRFYNEQYLLAAYLMGDDRGEVVFPVHYVMRNANEAEPIRRFGREIGIGDAMLNGGALWARKGGIDMAGEGGSGDWSLGDEREHAGKATRSNGIS